MIFKLNGLEYKKLPITNYSVKMETLDSEATGRTKAFGWPMIRDPEGTIINLALEFAGTFSAQEPEFTHLWNVCNSMGREEFADVEFLSPAGHVISQKMYLVMSELRYRRIEKNGVIYTDAIRVSFIAEKGT